MFLLVIAILAVLGGVVILGGAQSAIHEIEAFILFLIAAVLFSGAAIVESINNLREKMSAGKY